MNSNPWNHSEILLANQAGAYLGRGIERGAEGIARGIEGYAKQKQANRAMQGEVDAALGTLENMQKLPGVTDDVKQGAAAAAARLADPNVPLAQKHAIAQQAGQQLGQMVQMGSALTQQRAAQGQIDAQTAARTQEGVNRTAAAAALRPTMPAPAAVGAAFNTPGAAIPGPTAPDADRFLSRYTAAGGELTPEVVRLHNSMAADRGERGTPALAFQQDPVSGKRFATYGNQLQPSGVDPSSKPETPEVRQVQIGSRKLFYHAPGNRYFDEQGQPVAFSGAANTGMDLTDEGLGLKPGAPAASATPPAKEQFETGKVYKDSKTGEKARYLGNGKWEKV